MCPAEDNRLDRIAAVTPADERVGPGLSRQESRHESRREPPRTRGGVLETLLGDRDLAAIDGSGGDPYNSTGRHFRR